TLPPEGSRDARLVDWARGGDPVRGLDVMAGSAGGAPPTQHGYLRVRRGAGRRRRLPGTGTPMTTPVALTIAGSDSSAGAGIQADLKTFAAFGVYGLTVITAVTAQNTTGVRAVQEISTELIAAQVEAVADDFQIGAVKTGMLAGVAIIEALVEV